MPSLHRVGRRHFSFPIEPVETGTAQAGSTANTIKLAAGASAVNGFYNRKMIVITGGTGRLGDALPCMGYVGATKIATVEGKWVTTPDVTTTYAIYTVLSSEPLIGRAQAGGGNTIRSLLLDDRESVIAGFLNNLDLKIILGTGNAPNRRCRVHKHASGRVDVLGDFLAIPDATSDYICEGHLAGAISRMRFYLASGGNMVISTTRGMVGLDAVGVAGEGEVETGNDFNEEALAGMQYLEVAPVSGSDTLHLVRFE
jgi:hypothetical protein